MLLPDFRIGLYFSMKPAAKQRIGQKGGTLRLLVIPGQFGEINRHESTIDGGARTRFETVNKIRKSATPEVRGQGRTNEAYDKNVSNIPISSPHQVIHGRDLGSCKGLRLRDDQRGRA